MRMRRKQWTEPLLDSCLYLHNQPASLRGKWRSVFCAPEKKLYLEIGCGKGVSTVQLAHENPDINLIAIDEVRHVLAVTIKNAQLEYGNDPVDNLALSAVDAMFIRDTFSAEDGISRIYINFPNPWDEKAKHHKRRLTHPRQLLQYREFLTEKGEIFFKTDNPVLFKASERYLKECGFTIRYKTDDLHASGYTPNYVSEHEKLYSERGLPIHFLIAEMGELPQDFSYEAEGRNISAPERDPEHRTHGWENRAKSEE